MKSGAGGGGRAAMDSEPLQSAVSSVCDHVDGVVGRGLGLRNEQMDYCGYFIFKISSFINFLLFIYFITVCVRFSGYNDLTRFYSLL